MQKLLFHEILFVVCKSCCVHSVTKILMCYVQKVLCTLFHEIPYMLCTKAVTYIAPQNSSYVEHKSSCVYCSTKILIRSVRKLLCTLICEIRFFFFGKKSLHFKSIKLILYVNFLGFISIILYNNHVSFSLFLKLCPKNL